MPSYADYTVGWVCALSKEFTAAKTMLDENHPPPCSIPNRDTNQYALGKIGNHNVVIAVLPDGEYGLSSATNVATNMLNAFPNVRIGLLVGIGGGAPTPLKDIRLGDVIVSSAGEGTGGIFQYDFGRTVQNMEFQTTSFLNRAPTTLRTAISALKTEHEMKGHRIQETISESLQRYPKLKKNYSCPPKLHDRLYLSTSLHPPEDSRTCVEACGAGTETEPKLVRRAERSEGDDDPAIHYGTIASANQLMKDARIRDKLSSERGIICFEMEAAGLVNIFPCIVIRGICDYADTHKNDEWQGHAAMTAAAYAKELLSQVSVTRVEEESRISEVLGQLTSTVDTINSSIKGQSKILSVINSRAETDQYQETIDKLPYVKDATFDSYSEEHNPRCLENTRVDLLEQVSQWIENVDSKTVFWLNGMAGTGKSTVSRTVAQRLSRKGILGASFFFKRGHADRGSATKFCTTIARQLAVNQKSFGTFLQAAVEKDPHIGNKGLKIQFERLIMEPLADAAKHQSLGNSNIAMIVDALDECESEQDVRLIISLICQLGKLPNIRLRAFLTSRPELPIRLVFNSVIGTFQDFILHEIPRAVIEQDISVFFKDEMQRVVFEWNSGVAESRRLPINWPGEDNIRILVERAIPLFIFAATTCRFISDWDSSPKARLNQIIESASWAAGDKMKATYAPVLGQLLIGLSARGRIDAIREFKLIVGTIVCLETPLSAAVLSRLLGIDEDRIHDRLAKLHSVLDIPDSSEIPIRLFHLSFRDYLIDEGSYPDNDFTIDCKETSRRLSADCLRVMSAYLKTDICDLRRPGTTRTDIKRDLVDRHLPPELQYACVYWVKHQEGVITEPADTKVIMEFLKKHLLHWIEALVLLDRAWEISGFLKTLRFVYKNDTSLTDFLEDASKFLNSSLATVAMHPLQLYSHALIFAPENSLVKLNFKSGIPKWIQSVPDMTADWDSCLRVFLGHEKRISFIQGTTRLFRSLNGGCFDVLDWDTGEHFRDCLATSVGPMQTSYGSPVLSPDGKVLAVSTSRSLVEIRELQTHTICGELPANCDVLSELCFSPNSKLLVVATNDAWQIWDLAYRTCIHEVPQSHNNNTNNRCDVKGAFCFSADSMLLMTSLSSSVLRSHEFRISDCLTGECLFLGTASTPSHFMFTPDSKSFIFMPTMVEIQVWSTTTYSRIHNFSIPHMHRSRGDLRISPDSKLLLVRISSYEPLRIFSLVAGQPLCRSHIDQERCTFLRFTPDSKHVMVGDLTDGIQIWSTHKKSKFNMPIVHGVSIHYIEFSQDGQILLTLTSHFHTWRLQVWDWEKEFTSSQRKHELATSVHRITRVLLSPDSAKLAVICSGITQIYGITHGRLQRLFEINKNDRGDSRFSSDSSLLFFYDRDHHSFVLDLCTGVCVWDSCVQNRGFEFSSSDDSDWLAATVIPINTTEAGNARVLVSKRVGDAFKLQHILERSGCYSLVKARFSSDARLIAALDEESHIVLVWNLKRPLDEPYVIERCSSIAAFSNSFLAVGESGTRQINIWHIDSRRCYRTAELSSECHAFSPSERLLAIGYEGLVRVLDWRTGVRLVEVYGAYIPRRILEPEPLISFLPRDAGIKTPLGIFRMPKEILAPPCPPLSPKAHRHSPLFHVYQDSGWVEWRGNKLLKLPTEHDPHNVLVSNTQVIITLESRRPVMIGFLESQLFDAFLDKDDLDLSTEEI